MQIVLSVKGAPAPDIAFNLMDDLKAMGWSDAAFEPGDMPRDKFYKKNRSNPDVIEAASKYPGMYRIVDIPDNASDFITYDTYDQFQVPSEEIVFAVNGKLYHTWDWALEKHQKGFVDLNGSKPLVRAALSEAIGKLGSLGDEQAAKLASSLKFEDYCIEHNIDYAEMTEDDFEQAYYDEVAERERACDEYEHGDF